MNKPLRGISVLTALKNAITHGSEKAKIRALWHACDVLTAGSYSEDDIWTFGEVIDRLAEEIESSALAELSERLAEHNNAPRQTLRRLAMDDSIEVAGKILQYSDRLDVGTLVDCARTKSQQHLLAISKRRSVPEPVTDILVERGEQPVLHSVAANPGARFSERSFLHMLHRTQNDTILAETLGTRKDIPRHIFQQLIARAGEQVKEKIAATAGDDAAAAVSGIVTDATGDLQSKFGPASHAYFTAKRILTTQHRAGNLTEREIRTSAENHELETTMVGLSIMCALPPDVVERALMNPNRELALFLPKSLDFSWETTMAILFLVAPNYKIRASEVDALKDAYLRLDVATAQEVLENQRTRKNSAKTKRRSLPQLHSV